MQLIATRTYRETDGGADDFAYCDFLFRRADGSFCIEEADGCAPRQAGSMIVNVSLQGVYDWYKYRPDQITRVVVECGKSAAAAATTQTKTAQPRARKWLANVQWW